MTLTPATFPAALTAATAGSVLELGPGNYGNLVIYNRTFPDRLTIKAADPEAPPYFNMVLIRGTVGVSLEGVAVAFQPTAMTRENQNIVFLDGCKQVTVSACQISSGMAVNGIPETATVADASGNVLGWPVGRAVYMQLCDGVEISDCTIWNVQRAIAFYKALNVSVLRNIIRNFRRTAILGDCSNLLIEGNELGPSKPWRWGQTPIGDHGDYIALFLPTGRPLMTNVRIVDNITFNVPEVAILGVTLSGIDGFEVLTNLIEGCDHQGIVITAANGIVSGNVLPGRGGILIRSPSSEIHVSDNLAAFVEDRLKGSTGNTITAPRKLVSDRRMAGGRRVIQTTT